jgi:transposase
MDQYEMIRTGVRNYGKSISEMARITGHSRNTIRKALIGEPWEYKEREHQPYPVLEPFLSIIDGWLKEDKKNPRKQRHSGRRIFHRLKAEHGYTGSEPTVRRYVRKAKRLLGLDVPCAFIPCEPDVGQEAEVDWGTCRVVLDGVIISAKYFIMRSKYSGKFFMRLYPCERQQAFFDAHLHAFAFFGGVFRVLIYDNLTTAVNKVLLGHERVEQECFTKFKAYHGFEARFCNPNEGHEKGGVEGTVGFTRRNFLVPMLEEDTMKEMNAQLLQRCLDYGHHTIAGREATVDALFEAERSHLLPLPAVPFDNVRITTGRVDKYATVIVEKNRYSVPCHLAGTTARVVLRVDHVTLFVDGKQVAEHERAYANNKWILVPDHYLDLLQQRPMAFTSARPIRQWRARWPEAMEQLLKTFCEKQGINHGIKDFVMVLMLYRKHEVALVDAAVAQAAAISVGSSAGVAALLIHNNTGPVQPSSEPLESWPTISEPDTSVYTQLEGGK